MFRGSWPNTFDLGHFGLNDRIEGLAELVVVVKARVCRQ